MVGTPFDLGELAAHDLVERGLLDLTSVQYVRLVDVPGNGSFRDAADRPVLDAWLTVTSGGFDLDAVGAIHIVPEATAVVMIAIAVGAALLCNRSRSLTWRDFDGGAI
jgi:hypothetical protein